jgi:hypothetical protein
MILYTIVIFPPSPPQYPWFHYPNNIGHFVYIKKFIAMGYPKLLINFIPLR